MRLTDGDLKQINQEYITKLTVEQLRHLSEKMLEDLREARDRLNQSPQNSSRPSGSYAPWEQADFREAKKEEAEAKEAKEARKAEESKAGQSEEQTKPSGGPGKAKSKRKAGKQVGAKGVGRVVRLSVTGEERHKASACAGCGEDFAEEADFRATTGLYVLEIACGEGGIQVSHVKHLYGERRCGCGHVTETKPASCAAEPEWRVELTEWHLVGPMLSALIICLALRMRLSRQRIQEFLQDWLGIELSVGCIQQCINEGGRAAAPLEEALIAEIQQAELLHADETGWQENGRLVWLWVLRTATVTLYMIGSRSWTVIASVMEGYAGWLMSDGYGQYRHYGQRLRCFAHLIRKTRALVESCHPEAAAFGEKLLTALSLFIQAIYAARGDPTCNLPEQFADELTGLQQLCEQHRDHSHDKTKALARELLNDWEAIWSILALPHLPITNNVAERALRHWVIARKLSYGTRTAEGSRTFTLLASVIDTCIQRHLSPWPYIASVIAARRKGNTPPPIPLLAS